MQWAWSHPKVFLIWVTQLEPSSRMTHLAAVSVQSLAPSSSLALAILSLIRGPILLILLKNMALWLVSVFLFLFSWPPPKVSPNYLSSGFQCWSLSLQPLFCMPQALSILLMVGSVFEKKRKKEQSWIGSGKARIKRTNITLHFLPLIL